MGKASRNPTKKPYKQRVALKRQEIEEEQAVSLRPASALTSMRSAERAAAARAGGGSVLLEPRYRMPRLGRDLLRRRVHPQAVRPRRSQPSILCRWS